MNESCSKPTWPRHANTEDGFRDRSVSFLLVSSVKVLGLIHVEDDP